MHADAAQLLLQHARWDKERLNEVFFSDGEKVMLETGLDLFSPSLIATLRNTIAEAEGGAATEAEAAAGAAASGGGGGARVGEEEMVICRICVESVSKDQVFALGCGHNFCRHCYRAYLVSQISDGPSCILTHCPEHKCKQAVPRQVFRLLLAPEVLEKYDVYVTRNFIESSRNMRYCPAAGCDKVAVGMGVTTIKCSCSNLYCFRCGEDAHEPSSCQQIAQWGMKCSNESETANWILANTKKCPACDARIEKNQGDFKHAIFFFFFL